MSRDGGSQKDEVEVVTDLEIPALAETLALQNDLDELCRDRPLVTNEIFSGNAFYGHDRVVKRYANLSEDAPLYAVIPHAPYLDPGFVWGEELVAEVPAVLCYPEFRVHAYRAVSRKVVIPSASPYVYATHLAGEIRGQAREGTLFFLSHSTHHLVKEDETEYIVRVLTQVDERWRPVTVCIYWKDFLLGRHLPFLERGFRVVSAGHIYDPLFLFRLHHLCSLHRYSSGNAVGSHIFYSVHSGCIHVKMPGIGEPPRFGMEGARVPEENAVWVPDPPSLDSVPDVRAVFFTSDAASWNRQRAAVAYFLGYEHVLGREELGKQLRKLKVLDRTGYWRSNALGAVCCFPPTASQRFAQRVRSGLSRRLRLPTRKR